MQLAVGLGQGVEGPAVLGLQLDGAPGRLGRLVGLALGEQRLRSMSLS